MGGLADALLGNTETTGSAGIWPFLLGWGDQQYAQFPRQYNTPQAYNPWLASTLAPMGYDYPQLFGQQSMSQIPDYNPYSQGRYPPQPTGSNDWGPRASPIVNPFPSYVPQQPPSGGGGNVSEFIAQLMQMLQQYQQPAPAPAPAPAPQPQPQPTPQPQPSPVPQPAYNQPLVSPQEITGGFAPAPWTAEDQASWDAMSEPRRKLLAHYGGGPR